MDQEFKDLVKLRVGDNAFQFRFFPRRWVPVLLSSLYPAVLFCVCVMSKPEDVLVWVSISGILGGLLLVGILYNIAMELQIENGRLYEVRGVDYPKRYKFVLSETLNRMPTFPVQRLLNKLERAERADTRRRDRKNQCIERARVAVSTLSASESGKQKEIVEHLVVQQEIQKTA